MPEDLKGTRRTGAGTVRTLDLFCGGGGSGWGARIAGAEIVCGVDAWNLAARTYDANFGTGVGVNLTLNGNWEPALDGLAHIDLIMASPECRNHTCAKGNRGLDERSRATARYVLDFARRLEPRWIVLENVIHMRSWGGFGDLIAGTEALGYHVREQVLDASQFGVPQKRRRLFIICDREAHPDSCRRKAAGSAQSERMWSCGTDRGRPGHCTLRAGRKRRSKRRSGPLTLLAPESLSWSSITVRTEAEAGSRLMFPFEPLLRSIGSV